MALTTYLCPVTKYWQSLLLGNWSVIIARWNSSLSSLWPGFNSQPRRSISRDFSLTDHTLPPILSQRGKKWLNLPSITPHNLLIARRKVKVQPWIEDCWIKTRQQLAWRPQFFTSFWVQWWVVLSCHTTLLYLGHPLDQTAQKWSSCAVNSCATSVASAERTSRRCLSILAIFWRTAVCYSVGLLLIIFWLVSAAES